MASTIKIFRSTGATAPSSLEYGELAVTVEQGTAGSQANKAGRLFVGNASGNPVEIGGEYTYKLMDHVHGELINSSVAIVDSSGAINGWSVAGILTATRTSFTDAVTSNLNVTGVATFAQGLFLNGNVTIGDDHTDTLTINSRTGFNTDVTLNRKLLVTGISTFTGAIDANGGADVSGGAGLVVSSNGVNVTGVSTFNNNVVFGGTIDVDGQAIFDDITVSAASTFSGLLSATRASITNLVGTAATFTSALTIGSGASAYTFPSADGSASQVLTTDGNGVISFQSSSSSLDIAGDTGTDTVALLTDTLTFSGTTNEIVTAVTDNTVTISLPDDVIVGGGLTVTNNLLVLGDLTVEGTQTILNVEQVDVQDATIGVGSTSTASNTTANGGGFFVHGGSDGNKTIFWSLGQSGFEVNQDWLPNADGTFDLGNASREWENLFVDGLAELDDVNVSAAATINTLNVTGTGTIATADINGGNIDGTVIGAASSAAATFTTVNFNELTGGGITINNGRLDAGDATFTNLRVTGVSTVATLFLSAGTNTNGAAYFDASGQLQSTATPSAGIQTSNYILTTNASGVPSWTDTIDCGTF